MGTDDSLLVIILLYFWIIYCAFHCVIFSYDLFKENIIDIYFDRRDEDLTGFLDFEIIGDEDEAKLLQSHQLRPKRFNILNKIKEIGNPKINKKKTEMQKIEMKNKKIYLEKIDEVTDETSMQSLLYNNSDDEERTEYY